MRFAARVLSSKKMNTKPPVKVIKKEKREALEARAEIESVIDPNRWSKAVRSWVSEFQQHRDESLAAFDSLFK